MLTLRNIFESAFGFAEANAALIFGLSLLVPLVGITLAWVGRGGRTDEDGKAFANAFVFVGGLVQLVLILGLAALLVRQLFLRAFRQGGALG
jgi:hypothetical protein